MKKKALFVLLLATVMGLQHAVAAGLPGFVFKTDAKGTEVTYTPWNKTDLAIVEILLILAWKNAGYLGLDRYLLPALGTPWKQRRVTAPAPQPAAVAAR